MQVNGGHSDGGHSAICMVHTVSEWIASTILVLPGVGNSLQQALYHMH